MWRCSHTITKKILMTNSENKRSEKSLSSMHSTPGLSLGVHFQMPKLIIS